MFYVNKKQETTEIDYESGVMVPHNLPESSVTCLYYCKEASSLLVGYSTGCWQMWNLTTFCLFVLEPCDDPRHTLYIWVTHQPLSSIVERVNPLVGMYTAHFKDKNPVKDYGTYYQNLLQCALSFEMELTFDPDNSGGDSSVVSCCSISKSVSRTLIHFSIYQDPEPLPLRLFVSIWEAWSCSRERLETYVTLFDLNQWYREQMPAVIRRSVTDCPYLVTKNFPVGKSVAAGVPPDSLAVYTSAQPLEQHFYPSAMSLDCVIVDDGGLVHYRCKGIQERTLSELTTYGSVALVRPTSVFKAVVGASLVPIYGEQLDVDHPNVDDQRNYVLTVCLENNLSSTLLSCADHWFNGSHSVTGCTLGYLFDFLWDTLTNYKRHFDIISSSLFDQSGVAFDTNSRRRLQHCKFMMETIESVYSKISKKYNAYIMSDNVNQRLEAMQLMLLYYEMVIWFIGVDALPEQSSRGTPASSIPYNFDKLFLFCVKRREELKNGLGSRKSGSCGGATDYCRLLIDSLMEEEAGDRVGDQWEVEGGSEAARLYPPPSVQSLLRVCLMSGIAQSTKHDIIMYFLLDLVDLADYDKYQKSIDAILKYRFHFGISEGHSRVIQAFWYLDHALFEDGIQCLLNPSVNRSDLHGWQHRAVLRLLIRQSQNRLALRYLHVKRPSLNLPDDVRLEMGLLLSNGLITQAFMFQRSNRHLRESLLNQFFKGCLENNTLKTVFDLQLDKFEEEAFVKFLKSAHLKNSDSLQVLYLLSRAKYVDAIELHDKLNRQRSRTGGVTMNSTLEKRHPMYHRYTREDSSGFRTTGLVVKGIAGTICDIRQSVAKAASKIDPLLSRMSGKPPRPLSTSLKMSLDRGEVPNLMNTQDELITLTLAHAKHLEISLAQSDRNRLIAEEDSEAGSWSRKRRPADDLTTSTAKKTKVAVEVELSEDKLKRTPGRVGSPGGYQADVERMVSTPLVERKDRILYPSRTTQKPLSILKVGIASSSRLPWIE
ncbi:hypothetical protein AAG570_005400 [Ranatra chinensis]|uniref:ELYS-like domain-containing protein n=1 Tax=Ranatra chinensis TaxID=642074 RepID=A0ABD0Y0D7_9HEMI